MPLSHCIAKLATKHGGLRAAARAAGLDAGYLSRLRSGQKEQPSDLVLAALGLERVVNEEETMEYTATLPTEVGTYRHRWQGVFGTLMEQVLFVGYTNALAPLLQGTEPNAYMPRKLKCCRPNEHLHADKLTPEEWGGWWARIETPNV